MTWLKNTNATVSDVACAGPEDMKDKRLNDLTSLQNDCISTGEQNLNQLVSCHHMYKTLLVPQLCLLNNLTDLICAFLQISFSISL